MAEVITVKTNGNRKKVSYAAGMTAGQACRVAEMRVGWRSSLSVNDKPARSTTPVNPGDTITIAPRIRNGG